MGMASAGRKWSDNRFLAHCVVSVQPSHRDLWCAEIAVVLLSGIVMENFQSSCRNGSMFNSHLMLVGSARLGFGRRNRAAINMSSPMCPGNNVTGDMTGGP